MSALFIYYFMAVYLAQMMKNVSNRGRNFAVKIQYERARISQRRVQIWNYREKWSQGVYWGASYAIVLIAMAYGAGEGFMLVDEQF